MNRADIVMRIAAHQAAAAALRAVLEYEAQEELIETGTAPSWRLPDGSRVEVRTSTGRLIVTDEDAFMAWVRQAYPGEVVEVTELRFRAPAFKARVLEMIEEKVNGSHWELPPFVAYTSSGEYRHTSMTLAPSTRERLAAAARDYASGGPPIPELGAS